VYENEDNEIVGEIPRYNDFSANEDADEKMSDFVIFNYWGYTNVRQDMDMLARVDTKQFWPLAGLQDNSLMSRHYVDYSVLARYGMRVQSPIQNPNATTAQAAHLYSAIELINRNANTRVIKLTVPANKKYRVGRLYFIADSLTDIKVGVASQSKADKGELSSCAGYVGYLTSINYNVSYASPISYNLSFNYVRRSTLIVDPDSGRFAANFKILPDIGGLIDELQDETDKGRFDSKTGQPKLATIKKGEDALLMPGKTTGYNGEFIVSEEFTIATETGSVKIMHSESF
jgi:hypothetical protein